MGVPKRKEARETRQTIRGKNNMGGGSRDKFRSEGKRIRKKGQPEKKKGNRIP